MPHFRQSLYLISRIDRSISESDQEMSSKRGGSKNKDEQTGSSFLVLFKVEDVFPLSDTAVIEKKKVNLHSSVYV